MTPHHLHALAAAWSLAAALTALEARAREAAQDAIAGDNTGDVSIPSQVFGRRHALGGHGDPTAATALAAWAPGAPEPRARLLGDLMRELDRLAAHLPGAPGQDPLARITAAVPSMRPHIAARTGQALAHLDGQARRQLQMPPDLTAVDALCPACRMRTLYATGRWVVCRATGCACTGDGCPCGMPVRAEGAGHIWPRDIVLSAVEVTR